MKQLIVSLVFLVIWLPSLLFAAGNTSFSPPLEQSDAWKGPYKKWKIEKRSFYFNGFKPEMLIHANLSTKSGPYPVVIKADFMEWLYGGGRRKIKSGAVYITGRRDFPFVTQWGLEHDAGLKYGIGKMRFNGLFLFTLFFCLALPVLLALWLMVDEVTIDTPQERKRKYLDFVELVKDIENRAQGNPVWLRRKTIRLAFLGYLVVIGSILLMLPVGLGLGAALVVLTGGNAGVAKLAFIIAAVPIGFAWHMGKSLLSPSFDYEGVEVTAKDCPKLFALLEEICQKANGPMFKRVFIDNQLNASVTRSGGLLGFFGMGPVVLTIGLPLMQSQTSKQLSGVIGHEYGHVAAKDNVWGQWVYRIRNSWLVLDDKLRFEHLWYTLKLNRFYEWFIATFSAYSFALSRSCEYEADAFSARVAGKDAMAEALSSLAVYGDQYDGTFWRNIWERSDKGENLKNITPYQEIPSFFNNLGDVSDSIEQALKRKTDYTGTHPSVSDRLAALGTEFSVPEPPTPDHSAATALLEDMAEKLADDFSREWQEKAQEHWENRQEERQHWQSRYEELKTKPVKDMEEEDLRELISAAGRMEDDALYYKASEEMLHRHPDSTGALLNCLWYRLMIEKDESQLAEMEKLLKTHPSYTADVCGYAIEFFEKAGRPEEAKPYHDKLDDWHYLSRAANDERDAILSADEFKEHDLPEKALVYLSEHAEKHPIIARIYLAQKDVKYMPEFPCYVIAYKTKPGFWASQKKVDEDVMQFIYESGLPEEFLFIEADGVSGLEKKLKQINGAQIYQKAK
ncbi:MAG: hypothetical protein EP349_03480 [Alphaproteobacteria bacterium]|nr:MAG: hypothetical protein EP349_03480 [Alphaproteobacteria bacterium]